MSRGGNSPHGPFGGGPVEAEEGGLDGLEAAVCGLGGYPEMGELVEGLTYINLGSVGLPKKKDLGCVNPRTPLNFSESLHYVPVGEDDFWGSRVGCRVADVGGFEPADLVQIELVGVVHARLRYSGYDH